MDQICLVTGACGFVGSHLVDALVSQGVLVRATDLYNANRQYLPSSEIVEFVPADLTKPEEVKTIVTNVSTIFHPAGIFRFNTSRKLLYKVNVEGSTNLFSAALSEDISHIVNWSTAMIYGSLDYTPADEKHPIHPEEPYSESKWVQEQISFSFFEENGLPVSSLRPTAIYGPRSLYGTSQAILALANKKIPGIPGSGKTIQHHVHVKDVVNAAIFISKNQKTIGEAYNIADDQPISIEDSLKIVSEILEINPPKFHIPRRLVYIYAYFDRLWNKLRRKESLFEKAALKLIFSDHIFDNSKLKELGFNYSISDFGTGIKSTLQWYQEKGYIEY
ncbi:MAG: NAD-dependent epimerase/dehydratase family protein [Candidatus Hodarchaeota archaeon]